MSAGVSASAPRVPASSAASSMASRGWTTRARRRRGPSPWRGRRGRRPALDDEVGPAAQAGRGQRGVDGPGRQDRRDRQAIERRRAIGQDDDRRRRVGQAATASCAEPVERGLEAAGAVAGGPGRVERPDRGRPSARTAAQQARRGRRRSGARGATVRGAARQAAEQRRPPAQLDPQVHDDALALRVDGRVRDLGERLAQVVGDRPVEAAAAGRGRVVAHAPERLVALERHRLDVEPRPLGVEAGQVAQRMLGRRDRVRRGRRVRPTTSIRSSYTGRARVVDRQRAKRPRLRLGVLEDRPPARLDEQQLARPEAAAADGLGRAERHRAGLGRDGDQPVARHRERRRAQPVAIDQRADAPAVGEHDRGRAVPRREEARPSAGGAWRRADAARGGARAPRGSRPASAGVSSQPVAVRSSSASSSESESEPSGGQQRTGGEKRRARSPEPAASPARPRTCSRLPRTVLISPLWAIDRNGWASRQTGCVFVA